MDSLRIENWSRKIEVNDQGETIEYSVADSSFYEELISFAQWIQSDEIRTQAEEIAKQVESREKSGKKLDLNTAGEINSVEKNMSIIACEKIDKMFGEEASRKVFGNIIPTMDVVVTFLNVVIPMVKKNVDERNKKVNSQYNKGRRGAKS